MPSSKSPYGDQIAELLRHKAFQKPIFIKGVEYKVTIQHKDLLYAFPSSFCIVSFLCSYLSLSFAKFNNDIACDSEKQKELSRNNSVASSQSSNSGSSASSAFSASVVQKE